MGQDYLPNDELALRSFCVNFSQLVSQWASELGVPVEMADELAAKTAGFAELLQRSRDPETRGVKTVFLKNQNKAELKKLVRRIARMIQGQISVTDEQRQALGLTIHKTRAGAGVVVESAPSVRLSLAAGNKVRVTLRDADSMGRGRPVGAIGASIFSCVGELPANRDGWKFEGNTSRMETDIEFTNETPSSVWICAQWLNRTFQTSVWSKPVEIKFPGWVALPKAA